MICASLPTVSLLLTFCQNLPRFGSVTAQAYSQCYRNELCIGTALSEHIMEASFNEETDTAGLDVEAGPAIDAEIRAGVAITGRHYIVATHRFEVVNATTSNKVGAK